MNRRGTSVPLALEWYSKTYAGKEERKPRAELETNIFKALGADPGSAVAFARCEGILPAPKSAHAIRATVDEALLAREEGRSRVILFCLSGHGHFDLSSYESYLTGKLQDYEYPGQDVARALAEI